MLPDRAILIGQKLAKNAKIEKVNFDNEWTKFIWRIFITEVYGQIVLPDRPKINRKCLKNSNKTFWSNFQTM